MTDSQTLWSARSCYLVGIKGVAMTSLAQCLVDVGKLVRGADVAEAFVTQELLEKLDIQIDTGFSHELPADVDCVIFTSAHQAQNNPLVQQARLRQIPTVHQAEALATLFNSQTGIAVAGVGGKSTTSAMITWIMEKTGRLPSYSVGVGSIPGLPRTGLWRADAPVFVAEADEYVLDPTAPQRGESVQSKLTLLRPAAIVCTNLRFDHPDVFRDFAHTQDVYRAFFQQVKEPGLFVVNGDDAPLVALARSAVTSLKQERPTGPGCLLYGEGEHADWRLQSFQAIEGETITKFAVLGDPVSHELKLRIPGKYNALNALAALAVCHAFGVPLSESLPALSEFRSTRRRAEYIGEKQGVKYYDDYAHHPNEVQHVIHAFREWFPQRKLIVAFQSHTFSRTKALFDDFVQAFAEASEVVMIDIFASAREARDPTVSSDQLCQSITRMFPNIPAQNFRTIPALAIYLHDVTKPGDVVLTVGAGDIYLVHEAI